MRFRGCIVLLAAAMVQGGCASRSAPDVTPTKPSLGEYIGQVRHLSSQARPTVKTNLESVEATDQRLAAALAGVAVSPTSEAHHEAAAAYRRLSLLDRSFDYYNKALRLNSKDAAAYEGLARIWRDWGFPHLGLGDAHRAVYFAPRSASARNTMGTLLQALGQNDEARQFYERAYALDSTAAYVLNNLCYLSITEKKVDQAIEECRASVTVDPTLVAARANLTLAYAIAGRLGEAMLVSNDTHLK